MLNRRLIRSHERERNVWAAERRELLSLIAHLAGKPLPEPPAPPVEADPDFDRYVARPELDPE